MKNILLVLFCIVISNCFSQKNSFDTIFTIDKTPIFKLQVKKFDDNHFELSLINISKINIYIVDGGDEPDLITFAGENKRESVIYVGLCDNQMDDISGYSLTKLKKQKIYIDKFTTSKKIITLKVSLIIGDKDVVSKRKKFFFRNPEYYSKRVVFNILLDPLTLSVP